MDLVSKVGLGGLVWSFGSSRSGGSCGWGGGRFGVGFVFILYWCCVGLVTLSHCLVSPHPGYHASLALVIFPPQSPSTLS